MNFLPIHFDSETDNSTPIQTLIDSFFDKTPVEGNNCTQCAKPRKMQQWLGHPPEVLLVHLNRIGYGKTGIKKIVQKVSFTTQIKVSQHSLDPRLPARSREDVNYELSSVILHRGETTHSGHYRILAKSPAGLWVLLDDNRDPDELRYFDESAADAAIQSQAYVFAYRRLPLDPDYIEPEFEVVGAEEGVAAGAGVEESSEVVSGSPKVFDAKSPSSVREKSPRGPSPLLDAVNATTAAAVKEFDQVFYELEKSFEAAVIESIREQSPDDPCPPPRTKDNTAAASVKGAKGAHSEYRKFLEEHVEKPSSVRGESPKDPSPPVEAGSEPKRVKAKTPKSNAAEGGVGEAKTAVKRALPDKEKTSKEGSAKKARKDVPAKSGKGPLGLKSVLRRSTRKRNVVNYRE